MYYIAEMTNDIQIIKSDSEFKTKEGLQKWCVDLREKGYVIRREFEKGEHPALR